MFARLGFFLPGIWWWKINKLFNSDRLQLVLTMLLLIHQQRRHINKKGDKMTIEILAKQALEAAMVITGTDGRDAHTMEIAHKLACAIAAEEMAARAE